MSVSRYVSDVGKGYWAIAQARNLSKKTPLPASCGCEGKDVCRQFKWTLRLRLRGRLAFPLEDGTAPFGGDFADRFPVIAI